MTVEAAMRLLQVGPDVDSDGLRRAWLRAARRHRPEVDPEGFRRAREAFEVLEAWRSARDRAPEFGDDGPSRDPMPERAFDAAIFGHDAPADPAPAAAGAPGSTGERLCVVLDALAAGEIDRGLALWEAFEIGEAPSRYAGGPAPGPWVPLTVELVENARALPAPVVAALAGGIRAADGGAALAVLRGLDRTQAAAALTTLRGMPATRILLGLGDAPPEPVAGPPILGPLLDLYARRGRDRVSGRAAPEPHDAPPPPDVRVAALLFGLGVAAAMTMMVVDAQGAPGFALFVGVVAVGGLTVAVGGGAAGTHDSWGFAANVLVIVALVTLMCGPGRRPSAAPSAPPAAQVPAAPLADLQGRAPTTADLKRLVVDLCFHREPRCPDWWVWLRAVEAGECAHVLRRFAEESPEPHHAVQAFVAHCTEDPG